MGQLIEDYFKVLNCIGWERQVYIIKNGAFDCMAKDNGENKERNEQGFSMRGYNFVYVI